MPFPFDKYPWLNFQELNLAYFITHFREIFEQWDTLLHEMYDWKDATDAELAEWKSTVETGISSWETGLQQSMEDWKDATEADISEWEGATLTALDAWKTATTAVFEQIRTEAAASATAAAGSATSAQTALAGAQAAQAAAEAAAAGIQSELSQIQTNTADIADLKTQISDIQPFMRIDKTALISGYYVAPTGQRSTISTAGYYCTDYIPVVGIKKLKTTTSLKYCRIGFFDENKNPTSNVGQTEDGIATYEVDVPETARYVAISCFDGYPTVGAYNAFNALFYTTVNDLCSDIYNIQKKLQNPLSGFTDYVNQEMTTFIRRDKNSNLVYNDDVIEGSWISTTNGTFQTNQYTSRYSRTGYVEVEAGAS